MTNISDNTPATPESVWAALREVSAMQAENAKRMAESDARVEQRLKEWDAKLEQSRAAFEREMSESRAESEQRKKEWDAKLEQSRAAFEREMSESRAKFDHEIAESRAEIAESRATHEKRLMEWDLRYERRMANLENRYGSNSFNLGSFAEEYFYSSFEKGEQNFFGEKFDRIKRNVKDSEQIVDDEYDIVLYNCDSIAIIETKFKAHENDLPKVLNKAKTFRINHPKYANHRIYLGLSSMSFYDKLENKCVEAGIAIIKQVGDTLEINDKHLKVF